MATEWQMIRVSRETWRKLQQLQTRLVEAYQHGRRKSLPLGERDNFSLDLLIAELVKMKEDHMRRGSRKRRGRPIRYQG